MTNSELQDYQFFGQFQKKIVHSDSESEWGRVEINDIIFIRLLPLLI
jgi:hypothetical protein